MTGDRCEWWPEFNRPAEGDCGCPNVATVLVGSKMDAWRLCDGCAVLPHFGKKRRRVPIVVEVTT